MKEDQLHYQSFLDGDESGFEWLVYRYREPLIFFLYQIVKDLYAAEELAQDAFVEVLLHKDRYRMNQSFKTYLFTIGHHKTVDYIRKNKKIYLVPKVLEEMYSEQEAEKMEHTVLRKELNEQLKKSIAQLKREYQIILYLIDVEEVSYKEAAVIVGKTLSQTKVLIHRARKALKFQLLKEEYVHEE